MRPSDPRKVRGTPFASIAPIDAHLEMDVGFGAVAGVAAGTHVLAPGHDVTDTDGRRPLTQVGEQEEGTRRCNPDDDVVARKSEDAPSGPTGLPEGVAHEPQAGASRLVVRLGVVNGDDLTSDRRQHRLPEPDEALRRLDPDPRMPRPWSRAAPLVDRDEVDGVGDPERLGPVAGDAPGGTVLDPQPQPSQGKARTTGPGTVGTVSAASRPRRRTRRDASCRTSRRP